MNESPLGREVLRYEPGDVVYRVVEFRHLVNLLESNRLVFPRVCSWKDPYENFIYKARYRAGARDFGRLFETFNYQERLFGLCWSFFEESDALWRIYSPDGMRVKVACRVEALQVSITAGLAALPFPLSLGMGRVAYVAADDMSRLFSIEMLLNGNDPYFLTHDGLFVKRKEFCYEGEFRTILVAQRPLPQTTLLEVPIDPHSIIDDVVFDPRIANAQAVDYARQLRSLGIEPSGKSMLYEPCEIDLAHRPNEAERDAAPHS